MSLTQSCVIVMPENVILAKPLLKPSQRDHRYLLIKRTQINSGVLCAAPVVLFS